VLWNEPRWIQNSRDLVLANIKHRHWIRDVQNYVTGTSETPPPLDVWSCPLGAWLADQGRARYHHHPAFSTLLDAHDRVHAVARRLVAFVDAGRGDQAVGGLTELHRLRDELINIVGRLGERT